MELSFHLFSYLKNLNLNNNYIVILDDISKIRQREKNITQDNNELSKALLDKEKIVPEAINNMMTFETISEGFKNKQLIYIQRFDTEANVQAEKYNFKYREINYFKSEIEPIYNILMFLSLI